jgi:hypothetical protein
MEGSAIVPSASTAVGQGNLGTMINVSQPGPGGNPNFPQPFYQTMAYGPQMFPMGSGRSYGPVPEVLFPRTPAPNTHHISTDRFQDGAMNDGVRERIATTLREFGFFPKGRARAYQKPYAYYFDTIPYPRGFRVLDFLKFTGDDARSTHEHIGQFLAQVNDVGIMDVHRVHLFPLSLSGTAFNWFTSLPPNSIDNWVTLEQKFHDYFFNGEVELRLSDLTAVRQKYNETVPEYLRRFRETRNKCYNLTIGEKDLADLAFAGRNWKDKSSLMSIRCYNGH